MNRKTLPINMGHRLWKEKVVNRLEKAMPELNHRQLAKVIRWAGRIVATLSTAFLIVYSTSFSFFGNVSGIDVPVLTYLVVILALVVGLILAWWKDMTAAALFLVLISIGTSIFVYHFSLSFFAWLILALPFIIASILLITAGLLVRKGRP